MIEISILNWAKCNAINTSVVLSRHYLTLSIMLNSSINFQIVSDLHLEFGSGYESFDIPPSAPYLCLLGDIGLAVDDKLFTFLESQLKVFKIVYFVLGNHEAYRSSYSFAKQRFATFQKSCQDRRATLGEFIVLDQTRYDIENVTILGCTLYSNVTAEQHDHVSFGLNDFYMIENWSVEQHNDAHKSDVEWLCAQLKEIKKEPNRCIMVLTHHSPTLLEKAHDPRHRGSKLTSAFATDLLPELDMSQVKVWAYGHTHFNHPSIMVGEVELITNQRGYITDLSSNFDVSKVVTL